jgi:hypothetical protein
LPERQAIHDGYLFTIGVSGTPHGDRPAARLLLAMMEALPPVKRVAALGDAPGLVELVLGDTLDAELLLLATPAGPRGLPARLFELLERAALAAGAGRLRGKVAGLVVVGLPDDAAVCLAALRRFCAGAGVQVAGGEIFPLVVGPAELERARRLARRAYLLAERTLPVESLASLGIHGGTESN